MNLLSLDNHIQTGFLGGLVAGLFLRLRCARI